MLSSASEPRILSYESRHREQFKRLNVDWIQTHWELEPEDYKALDDPEQSILTSGGYIAIAELAGEVVGTCALLKMDDSTFELAKMAGSVQARGQGLGLRLGEHVIDKARELGAGQVYLESNTVLEPAIRLYGKLGFVQIVGEASPYERCNIQMELRI